jgi:hypothetical protein
MNSIAIRVVLLGQTLCATRQPLDAASPSRGCAAHRDPEAAQHEQHLSGKSRKLRLSSASCRGALLAHLKTGLARRLLGQVVLRFRCCQELRVWGFRPAVLGNLKAGLREAEVLELPPGAAIQQVPHID